MCRPALQPTRRADEDLDRPCAIVSLLELQSLCRPGSVKLNCPGGGMKAAFLFFFGLMLAGAPLGLSHASAQTAPNGRYTGEYQCRQGATQVTIDIASNGANGSGTFSFFAPRASGSYTIKVVPNGASFDLVPVRWINRPGRYELATARVTMSGNRLDGRILGLGCGEIHVALSGSFPAARNAETPEHVNSQSSLTSSSRAPTVDRSDDSVLSPIDVVLTRPELNAVIHDPREFSRLCNAHNLRACYVISAWIDELHFSDVMRDNPEIWPRDLAISVLTGLQDVCDNHKSAFEHDEQCLSAETIRYAIAHNYGSKANDPTNCLTFGGDYSRTDYVWVDQYGHKIANADSEYYLNGSAIRNRCPYRVSFLTYNFERKSVTIGPHQMMLLDPTIMEAITNVSDVHFRWVKRQ